MLDGSDSKIDKIYTIQSIQYNKDPHVLPLAAKGPYLLVTGKLKKKHAEIYVQWLCFHRWRSDDMAQR